MESYSLKLGTSCLGPKIYDAYSDAETLAKASSLRIYAIDGTPYLEQSPPLNATLSDGLSLRRTDEMGQLIAGDELCGQNSQSVILALLSVCFLVLVILAVAVYVKIVVHRHVSGSRSKSHVAL